MIADIADEEEESCEQTEEGVEDRRNIYVERTLAIVKPDAMHKYNEIEDAIIRNGFTILQKRRIQLTPEQASEFYAEHFGKLFFSSLNLYMSSGPIMALMLARNNAVQAWNHLIGPKSVATARHQQPNSLRAKYGDDDLKNALHGSETEEAAHREISFFFPNAIVEPIVEGSQAKDYLARSVNPTLLKGLTALCKAKPNKPAHWLAEWLLANNPYKSPVKETPEVCVIEEP